MIDLRSDTVTRPSAEMRRAMAAAEVGDDVLRDDPTTIRLEERAAELLGKPASLFVPSGTMANVASIRGHTHHGDEVICEETSHIVQFEVAAHAALSGVQLRQLRGDRGRLDAEQVVAAIRPMNIHVPVTRVVELENTHNRGGGSVYPVRQVAEVARAAHEHGAQVHMDGARLMNACVALGVEPRAYTQHVDSCTLCFSKALGAPIGSIIAGDPEFIETVRRIRKMLGGGMRQVGIIAAAALYAIDHNIDRLAEDHANAKRLAEALADLPGIELDPDAVETNIVIFRVARGDLTATELVREMAERGVAFLAIGPDRCRMVTHLDASREEVDTAIERVRRFLT
ncbi:MAG: GntG family PLP-dependent aldolase [Planctomycetota bacterium]